MAIQHPYILGAVAVTALVLHMGGMQTAKDMWTTGASTAGAIGGLAVSSTDDLFNGVKAGLQAGNGPSKPTFGNQSSGAKKHPGKKHKKGGGGKNGI